MILIDKMKDLKIYKTATFLPTKIDNKKKKCAVLLFTPNYESSKKLMNHPLFVNKLRYQSYWMQRDASYLISSKGIIEDDIDSEVEESYMLEMTAAERNKLPDSAFGIPSKRKYPLDTEAHVRSAIKFFNYVDKEDEAELARNIIKAMKKFNITDVKVGKNNRFSKYYKNTNESVEQFVYCTECGSENIEITDDQYKCTKCGYTWDIPISESIDTNPFNLTCECGSNNLRLQGSTFICNECGHIVSELREESIARVSEDYINEGITLGNRIMFINEDAKNDSQLKRIIYSSRIRQRKEVLVIFDQVKSDLPFIKYTYPELKRYQQRNLFVDLSYYHDIFNRNNPWGSFKGLNLYMDFMERLLTKSVNLKSLGYDKETIFIPIKDYDIHHNASVWNFRININPISAIYWFMFRNEGNKLKRIFGDRDIIFVGDTRYFKLNFSRILDTDYKKTAMKFKIFISKICKGEEFDIEDIDTSADTDSSEVIAAKIVDRIEISKGVDLTPKVAVAKQADEVPLKIAPGKKVNSREISKAVATYDNKVKKIEDKVEKDQTPVVTSKLAQPNTKNIDTKANTDKELEKLAKSIVTASDKTTSEDDALNFMDDEEIKKILIDLDSVSDDSEIVISDDRKARMSELQNKLMQNEVNGKSIQQILDEKPEEIPKTTINVASPNADEWKDLKFMNFDKTYNLEKDIINAFKAFADCSRPLVIKEISSKDNSTSEDRVQLYSVEYEDYRGKRFKVNLDIPIMKDNRFLLRGNPGAIQNQFFNMPIIKTNERECQIVTNYNKIFVSVYGSIVGKSLPSVNKFVKAANKYTGRKIKFVTGNNKKICSKYNLPLDYIDLATIYSRIETDEYIVYFNQDEIRSTYEIDLTKGIPFAYNKKNKEVIYFNTDSAYDQIIYSIMYLLNDDVFMDAVNNNTSLTACAYSRCSLMATKIPTVVICGYHEGLRKTLDKANIKYELKDKLTREEKFNFQKDYIKFSDGYIYYDLTYDSSLLLNGLKDCPTDLFPLASIDDKKMYLEFLDGFGGRIKADGLENFYDLLIDPITKETLEHYKFPTDYVSILLYANALLSDNRFIKHTDTSSRRVRRYELVAAYTYKVLANAYGAYANELKHRSQATFKVNQDDVIKALLTDPTFSTDSCINALRELETTNSVTTKGLSGMNSDRAYSLDKRTYDDSMLNVLGMSTGFAGNVGVTRQASANANIEGERGYVKGIDGDTSQMNDVNTLTATELLTPFGSNRDDPMRTAMTYVQTAKHMVRTIDSDPLLVTNGADEALAYMTTDRFAFKAKSKGKISEITDDYIMIDYDDGTSDYINLKSTIEKNSDGGYFVPLKLDKAKDYKVGDKVNPNDVVAYDKASFSNSVGESDNIAYNVGKLAKIAIVNTDEGFEDSGIITEKMAKKLATPINYQFSVFIDAQSEVYKFLKVGQHVEVNDSLLVWMPPYDDESADLLLKNMSTDDVSELGKKVLTSNTTGTITAVKIYRTVEISELSDSLAKIVDNYERPLRTLEKKLKAKNIDISQIPAHYKLPPVGKLKGKDKGVLVEFYVEYLDTVGVGDKVVYFAANKATEKNIIPENLEPYTAFRPNESIDAFVSETSIDKRMVTSTLIYGSLQKLMIELDRSVKDIMGIPYDDSTV